MYTADGKTFDKWWQLEAYVWNKYKMECTAIEEELREEEKQAAALEIDETIRGFDVQQYLQYHDVNGEPY